MLIQLQPVQISLLWETIRKSVVSANRVAPEKELKYSNRLLANLLSGKYQCWLVYQMENDEKQIVAIGITAIVEDHLYNMRTLDCLSLYGFRRLTSAVATESFDKLKDYAKRNQCEVIRMQSGVPRMQELIEEQGLKPAQVLYELFV